MSSRLKKFRLAQILIMVCSFSSSLAIANVEDFGTRGHLFDIEEESIIEEIMNKLKMAETDGTLEKLNEEFIAKVKVKILRPNPVANISKSKTNRSWTYDPSFTQEKNIKDEKGRIIVAAGTRVNGLEKLKWGEPMIFINGDDKDQVEWVKKQSGKIVLVSGAPLELGDSLKRPVFFDQGGMLCRRFKIEAVPAIIEQEETLLKISEIKI